MKIYSPRMDKRLLVGILLTGMVIFLITAAFYWQPVAAHHR